MNKNISHIGKKCYGCSACADNCPLKAIDMKINEEGFLYPSIDNQKCINCSKCLEVCPAVNGVFSSKDYGFYAFTTSEKFVINSASGGIATVISRKILQLGGVVCGCALIENKARHVFIENEQDLYKIQSSKYIASDIRECFIRIKSYIEQGKVILFIGTPCQVAGIKRKYASYDKIFFIDLICHGTPSQKAFDTFIDSLESKEKSKIENFSFRYKKVNGWGTNYFYMCKNGTIRRSGKLSSLLYGYDFEKSLNFRMSCYNCEFADVNNRPGDITIGDYWGVHKFSPHIKTNFGVSSIKINTSNGKFLLEHIPGLETITKEAFLYNQGNLIAPTKLPNGRNNYYKDIESHFFNDKVPLKVLAINNLKSCLPKFLIIFLKNVKTH